MYLVPDDLMDAFVASTAARIDEPIMFRKGPSSLIEGIGEVYADFAIFVLPQDVGASDMLEDDEVDGAGDATLYVDPAPIPDLGEEDEGHTCDCE